MELRYVFAGLVALHGLVHLVGFVVPWRFTELSAYPYTTKIVWGTIDVGPRGARALGVAWLIACFAFLASAVGVGADTEWAAPVLTSAAILSAVLCVTAAPASVGGLAIDLAILAQLLL